MTKILITGATGFIGKHLVKKLSNHKKNKIKCLVRKDSKEKDIDFLKNCGAEIVFGDLFDLESLSKATKGIHTIFHLAGGGYVATTFNKGYEELKKLNIETTKNIFEAAVKSKVKKIVHFSSISAMGIIVEKELDENSECLPKTPHEVCKLETEKIAESFKDKILVTIIRPGIVYGPFGVNSEILQLAKMMKKHFFVIPGNGKNIMPWVYVDDVINSTILAYEKNKESCNRFIIVSSPEPTFNQLINSIRKNVNSPVFIIHIPKFLFLFAGFILEKLGVFFSFAPPINSIRAKSMTSNRIYSINKLKEIGYVSEIPFEDSMKQTIEWYKSNGFI